MSTAKTMTFKVNGQGRKWNSKAEGHVLMMHHNGSYDVDLNCPYLILDVGHFTGKEPLHSKHVGHFKGNATSLKTSFRATNYCTSQKNATLLEMVFSSLLKSCVPWKK